MPDRHSSSTSATAYAYDANGRRVSQTSTGGSIESFYDRAGQLIWQRDRDSNTHDDLYLGGKLVAIEDFNSAGTNTGTRYQHTDALGSVVAQTASNGQVIVGTQAIYDAWGGVHGISMQDGPGYTGHVEDAATGLVYMQQRYYDPNVGRFLSMDPVEADGKVGGNLDRYWYANDNPYRYTDPTGMCTGSNIASFCPSATKIIQVAEHWVAQKATQAASRIVRGAVAAAKQYVAGKVQEASNFVSKRDVVATVGVSGVVGAPIKGNSVASPGVALVASAGVTVDFSSGQVALQGSVGPAAAAGGGAAASGNFSIGLNDGPLTTGFGRANTAFAQISAVPESGVPVELGGEVQWSKGGGLTSLLE